MSQSTNDNVTEVVLYRLKPEVTRDGYLAETHRVCSWLEQRPGYLARERLETDDGQWIDIIRWETMDHALAAAAAFPEERELAPLMDALDPESVHMIHARHVP